MERLKLNQLYSECLAQEEDHKWVKWDFKSPLSTKAESLESRAPLSHGMKSCVRGGSEELMLLNSKSSENAFSHWIITASQLWVVIDHFSRESLCSS